MENGKLEEWRKEMWKKKSEIHNQVKNDKMERTGQKERV